ncbi:MAG TPA: NAD(P)/FAD-dependent oxidoreductase [Rubrobacter sp.]|nr:NAD(P)/FAD-dependent oxidoreductase [Rubrobacter sp.]
MTRESDVLVIGGGQAGLAMGYHLKQAGHQFRILERHPRIGDSWRNRHDSLVLFTPRAYSALPGLPVPGDPDGYPNKDEMADYLEHYANYFELPVSTETGIRSLTQANGGFRARTDAGEIIDARAVVLATGAFQRPAIPAVSRRLSPDVLQLTTESYKRPGQIPPGRVLVVGDGATGRQVAVELAATHEVLLATGRPRRVSPQRILGRSVFWWMDRLGILRASRETRVGRYLMNADPFPGKDLNLGRLRRRGVRVVGRLLGVDGKSVAFADGETAEVDAVIWATGYRDDSRWVSIPEVKDARDGFVHRRGVSAVPGVYFVGRSWQWTRGSALLAGVGDDAAYVVRQIDERLSGKRTENNDQASRSVTNAARTEILGLRGGGQRA